MVPVDGPVREGVGLLRLTVLRDPPVGRARRHVRPRDRRAGPAPAACGPRTGTTGTPSRSSCSARWIDLFLVTLLGSGRRGACTTSGARGRSRRAVGAAASCSTVFDLVALERASTGFRRLRPQFCSIYDPHFWWHERYWKLVAAPRPSSTARRSRALMWRLLGVRVGRRLFDDGCDIPSGRWSRSATTARSTPAAPGPVPLAGGRRLQVRPHRDRGRRLHRSGVGAWIHYGVTMGDGVVAGPRLVPHEGRGDAGGRPVGREPGRRAAQPPSRTPFLSTAGASPTAPATAPARSTGTATPPPCRRPLPGRHRADGGRAAADRSPAGRHAASAAPWQS